MLVQKPRIGSWKLFFKFGFFICIWDKSKSEIKTVKDWKYIFPPLKVETET